MKPALITHEISARHDVPAGHPERPERYASILDHIGDNYQSWQRAAAPLAERSQLELVHSESYLDMVFDLTGDADEPAPLDADTWAPASAAMNVHRVRLAGHALPLIW